MAGKILTDRTLKALARKPAAPGKTYDVADGVVPGLAVRVMPSGVRSFVLVARFPGSRNPTRRSLGAYGALTLQKAREKARTWLQMIERGVDLQPRRSVSERPNSAGNRTRLRLSPRISSLKNYPVSARARRQSATSGANSFQCGVSGRSRTSLSWTSSAW